MPLSEAARAETARVRAEIAAAWHGKRLPPEAFAAIPQEPDANRRDYGKTLRRTLKRRVNGDVVTSVAFGVEAWEYLLWLMQEGPFKSKSKAVTAAVRYFCNAAMREQLQHELSEHERLTLERLAAEGGCTPGELMGLAIRYLARQIAAGERIEA